MGQVAGLWLGMGQQWYLHKCIVRREEMHGFDLWLSDWNFQPQALNGSRYLNILAQQNVTD